MGILLNVHRSYYLRCSILLKVMPTNTFESEWCNTYRLIETTLIAIGGPIIVIVMCEMNWMVNHCKWISTPKYLQLAINNW